MNKREIMPGGGGSSGGGFEMQPQPQQQQQQQQNFSSFGSGHFGSQQNVMPGGGIPYQQSPQGMIPGVGSFPQQQQQQQMIPAVSSFPQQQQQQMIPAVSSFPQQQQQQMIPAVGSFPQQQQQQIPAVGSFPLASSSSGSFHSGGGSCVGCDLPNVVSVSVHGHPLTVAAPAPLEWRCDGWKVPGSHHPETHRMPIGEPRWTCAPCNYDLCRICVKKYQVGPPMQQQQQQQSPQYNQQPVETQCNVQQQQPPPSPQYRQAPQQQAPQYNQQPVEPQCNQQQQPPQPPSPQYRQAPQQQALPYSEPQQQQQQQSPQGNLPPQSIAPLSDSDRQARRALPCAMETIHSQLLLSSDYEPVLKYGYDYGRKRWSQTLALAKIEAKAFAEGGLRRAYRMTLLTEPSVRSDLNWVAKDARPDKEVDLSVYFDDVEMQALCQYMASEYNKRKVPKKISFLDAFVIERFTLPGRPLMGCEPELDVRFYKKYNANQGWVTDDQRNTPQSFSHFSYHQSGGSAIIVDLQGVGDCYTDPQVHTVSNEGFGVGNCGQQGIEAFFKSHVCNDICVGLKIADRSQQKDFTGTCMGYKPTAMPSK